MKTTLLSSVPLLSLSVPVAFATPFPSQSPPASTSGVVVKDILEHPGLSISYKQTRICETEARGWAGYVHMPSTYLEDVMGDDPYNISIFFWYIEARNDPQNAPTAIFLAGGPGVSGLDGTTSENGPCYINRDSNSTTTNPWSWNVYANMLYIDQPVSTGFSYSNTPINSTLDLLAQIGEGIGGRSAGITPVDEYNGKLPEANVTFTYGLLPDQNPQHTANNTVIAARTLWHFAQAWFSEFPEYCTSDKSISIWGNSYGGYWVPRTAALFLERNEQIAAGKLEGITLPMNTAGITNGCIDAAVSGGAYPDQAYNNSYGIEFISKAVYEEAKNNFTKPGGCLDLITQCRELGDEYDPQELALNETVNDLCAAALGFCAQYVIAAFDVYPQQGPRSEFDFAHSVPDSFPPAYYNSYFNREWVREELGVPLNFTSESYESTTVILGTGDAMRRRGLKDIEYLLNNGVKVALVYGDRDYRCPWNGAEELSLAAEWTDAEGFRAAGYEFIQTNDTYQGGAVRQYGNLSFSRVFEAGHSVGRYQPQTVWDIFNRAQFDMDVATGKVPTRGVCEDYATKGPASSFDMIDLQLPDAPPVECYVLEVSTCTEEQLMALANGTAVIDNYFVVSPSGNDAAN